MFATLWLVVSVLPGGLLKKIWRFPASIRYGRLAVVSLLGCGLAACAQSAHFAGVQATISTGYGYAAGIAVDGNENLYIADMQSNSVIEILAVNGSIPPSPTVVTLATGLASPQGIAVDSHGNVYFADAGHNAVKEIVAVNGVIPPSPAIVTLTTIEFPTALTLDASGDLFFSGGCVPEPNNGLCGSILELLAVNGVMPASPVEDLIYEDGSSSNLAFDAGGNLYFVDGYSNGLDEMLAVNGSVTASSSVRTITTFPTTTKINGIVLDSSGNLYGTNILNNVVDKMFAVGGSLPVNPVTETLGSGFSEPAGLAIDSSGTLYIEDALNNRTVSLKPSAPRFGSIPVRSSSSGIPLTFTFDSAGSLGSIAALTGGAPALDFASTGGGSCAPNTAYNAGQSCTVSASFTPLVAGDRHGAVVLRDLSGNPIATAFLHGTGTGPQITFAPGSQSTIAATGSALGAVAVDGSGNVYVAAYDSPNIWKETPGAGGYTQQGPLGSGLISPVALAVDGAGNLYVADQVGNRVVRETPSGTGYLQTVVASGLTAPNGVSVDGSGNVYIPQSSGIVEATLTPSGFVQSTIPVTVPSGPTSIAVDGSGDIYLASSNEGSILKETLNAGVWTQTSVASGLGQPQQIAVDPAGNVYVADSYNAAVVKETWNGSGYTQTTVADEASNGIRDPYGVAVDSSGNVYIADIAATIWKEDLADAPSLSFTSTTDGVNTTNPPQTVTVENNGNAPLVLPAPANGNNPAVTGNFSLDAESTCPLTAAGSAPGSLPPSDACTLTVDFNPTGLGSSAGSLVLTDNNLNAPAPGYTTQAIGLTGVQESPAFTLGSSVASGPLSQGSTLTSIITVNPQSGFSVNPTLTVLGLPAGVTASFSANPTVSGSSVLTLTASPTATAGLVTVTVTGTFGTQTASVALQIDVIAVPPGFSLAAAPAALAVPPGSSAPTLVTVADQGGFTGSVSLTISGLPSGVTAAFSPKSTTSSSTLTLTVRSSAVPGTYQLAITGTAGTVKASGAVTLIVQSSPGLAWTKPASVAYGTALSPVQLDATTKIPGTFTYSPVAGTVLSAGSHTLTVTFTPFDTTDYTSAKASVTLSVTKAAPAISWPAPAPIVYGTSLSSAQLDATANIPGTFTYSPAQGSVLKAGTHTLTVTFTPSDSTDYTTAKSSVSITVTAAK